MIVIALYLPYVIKTYQQETYQKNILKNNTKEIQNKGKKKTTTQNNLTGWYVQKALN